MKASEVSALLKFSELPQDPPRRLSLKLTHTNPAIFLLNDYGLAISTDLQQINSGEFSLDTKANAIRLPLPSLKNVLSEVPPLARKAQPGKIYLTPNEIIIPNTKINKSEVIQMFSQITESIGSLISNRNALIGNSVQSVEIIPKANETPFYEDKYGDSYNSSYYCEPRLLESEPSTIFTAVENIMEFAKKAFQQKDFNEAALKYQKAFHYCHKFFPEDLSDKDLETFTKLKIRSLLNLALSGVNCNTNEWLKSTIECCDFVCEMPEATETDLTKAYYRKARAYLGLNDDENAQLFFTKCLEFGPNNAAQQGINECKIARRERRAKLQQKLRNAF